MPINISVLMPIITMLMMPMYAITPIAVMMPMSRWWYMIFIYWHFARCRLFTSRRVAAFDGREHFDFSRLFSLMQHFRLFLRADADFLRCKHFSDDVADYWWADIITPKYWCRWCRWYYDTPMPAANMCADDDALRNDVLMKITPITPMCRWCDSRDGQPPTFQPTNISTLMYLTASMIFDGR